MSNFLTFFNIRRSKTITTHTKKKPQDISSHVLHTQTVLNYIVLLFKILTLFIVCLSVVSWIEIYLPNTLCKRFSFLFLVSLLWFLHQYKILLLREVLVGVVCVFLCWDVKKKGEIIKNYNKQDTQQWNTKGKMYFNNSWNVLIKKQHG